MGSNGSSLPARPSAASAGVLGTPSSSPAGAWSVTVLLAVFLAISTNLIVVPVFADFYDARRIIQLILLAALVATLCVSSSLREAVWNISSSAPLPLRLAATGLVAVGFLSAVLAPLPWAGIREVVLLVLVVVVGLCAAVAASSLGRRFDMTMIVVLVASGFVYTVLFVVLRRAHINLFGFESLAIRPYNHFYGWSNARFFGQFAVLALPLLAAAPIVLRNRSRLTRAGAWLVAVAWWALVLEAGGRGSILFLLIALVLSVVVLGRLAWPWARNAMIAIVAGSITWIGATFLMNSLYGTNPEVGTPGIASAAAKGTSDNNRFDFWVEAFEMIASRPLLGVGPEHYAYYQRAFTTAAPHNVPLQFAAEWGVPAALTIVGVVLWAGVVWARRWMRRTDLEADTAGLLSGLTAAAAGIAMLGLVEGVTVPAGSQVTLAVVGGWMYAYWRRDRAQSPTDPGRSPGHGRSARPGLSIKAHVGLATSGVLLLGVLTWSAGPYLWAPAETLRAEIQEHELEKLYPRFWLQGRLFDQ